MDDFLTVISEIIFVAVWSFIGSLLGFFSFTDTPNRPPTKRVKRALLSIGVGMFIAFPIFFYLIENNIFSTRLSIMASGMCAFGLPDFILKHYTTFFKNTLFKFTNNKTDSSNNSNE